MMKKTLSIAILFLFALAGKAQQTTHAGYEYTSREWKRIVKESPDSFFLTAEARRIADNVLAFQRVTGGWPKNIPIHRELGREKEIVLGDKNKRNDSTTDNDATILEMQYLARLYRALKDTDANPAELETYKAAFLRGVEFMLSGQYDNGGWPQFWPENRGYQKMITYNDNAMVQTMQVIRDLRDGKAPYDILIDDSLKARLAASFDKGVECILNTQIRVNGKPTVWCQQHDPVTLAPAPARSYELASFCTSESAALVRLLMEIKHPDQRIKDAVIGAMDWFDAHKLTGIREERYVTETGIRDKRIVSDPTAAPLWARFYDLKTEKPFFCDRDGVPRENMSDIGHERRNGYGWYSEAPGKLLKRYAKWKEKNGIK